MSAPIIKLFTQPNFAWTGWGVGLLVLVTILVWFNVLTPEYLRATVG
ncbi:hypothetical protein [Pseudomonas fluorescens]|jgi:hypothetical protein|uniref:ABC transporter permease n=1 Tax=Pseudomonas fluorescens TaxID=294 RepID=A0A5E7IDW0_PSEFL|nr:hypothetical protein [Pseudomonas fluorescens]VVO73902.1 hypothetical protein PS854_01442 [Pseudomonas fluorescens]